MLAYTHKKLKEIQQEDGVKVKVEWSFDEYEKIQRIYRSHRNMDIIDGNFIEKVLRESINVKLEGEV